MFIGDINSIDLGTSSFERIIANNSLYVDKSAFIEHFINEASQVQLVARQRRLGKSLNMDMLRCFLTDAHDYRPLFSNLRASKSNVWVKANSAPVFYFDFKNLTAGGYAAEIMEMVREHAAPYIKDPRLPGVCAESYKEWRDGGVPASGGLLLLTKIAYSVAGKRPYVLIDEYDKIFMDNAASESYAHIRDFMTHLFSAGLKGNPYLEKALLTGVTRVSYEGLLSGLNNLTVFDVFDDAVYAGDYGLTEDEAAGLAQASGFDLGGAGRWYNGIKVNGEAIYNTFGVMSMIKNKKFSCYWGNTGAMRLIAGIMGPEQKREMTRLLNPGERLETAIENRISPEHLRSGCPGEMFYSLLVQSGYLALDRWDGWGGEVSIPNMELSLVWGRFLLSNFFRPASSARKMLPDIGRPESFAEGFQAFMRPIMEALSFHDLPKREYSDKKERTPEIHYHLLLYGVLCAYQNEFKFLSMRSNRESGDGRYDIWLEFPERVVILEIKPAAEDEDLKGIAEKALGQIIDNRYGADAGKPVTAVGCAFCGKLCAMVGKGLFGGGTN